jgi:small subunit ribosomal protein S20
LTGGKAKDYLFCVSFIGNNIKNAINFSDLEVEKVPNKKAQAKSMRQNKKRNLRNKAAKAILRSQIKKVRTALENKNVEEVKTNFNTAVSVINKTAERGIIHKRKAARLESRLTKKVNELLTPPAGENTQA